jgi:hypothetical protein
LLRVKTGADAKTATASSPRAATASMNAFFRFG